MKCPFCETEGAYLGFKEVECTNKACEFYSEKLEREKLLKNASDDYISDMPDDHPPSNYSADPAIDPSSNLFGCPNYGNYP